MTKRLCLTEQEWAEKDQKNGVATTRYGISGKAHLIRYQEPFDLANLFKLFGKSDAKNIKIDLGMDLPKLQAGRPYFLSPTLVQ